MLELLLSKKRTKINKDFGINARHLVCINVFEVFGIYAQKLIEFVNMPLWFQFCMYSLVFLISLPSMSRKLVVTTRIGKHQQE